MSSKKSAMIYAAALAYIGVAEIAGKASNPLIEKWIKEAADWLPDDDSETAWCGCFRGHLGIETGTGVPPAHYRAASWSSWGDAVPSIRDAIQGDTLIFSRPGGHHVALLASFEAGRLLILGGNQSDKVCIAPGNLSALIAIRR